MDQKKCCLLWLPNYWLRCLLFLLQHIYHVKNKKGKEVWKPLHDLFHREMDISADRKYHSNQRGSPPQKDINPALHKANNEAQQS